MKLLCLFCLVIFCMAAFGVYADDAAGAVELKLIQSIFTGNLGLTLGLAVAAMGIFSLIKGNVGGAITLIILGVLITLLPAVYSGLKAIACPIAASLGGECGGT